MLLTWNCARFVWCTINSVWIATRSEPLFRFRWGRWRVAVLCVKNQSPVVANGTSPLLEPRLLVECGCHSVEAQHCGSGFQTHGPVSAHQFSPHLSPIAVVKFLNISFYFDEGSPRNESLVNLTPNHIYPSGGFSSNKINRVKPVHGSDKSLDPSIFQ